MSVAFILRRSEPPVCVEVKLMPCKELLCTQKGCQLIKQRNIKVLEGGLNYRCRYLSSIDQLTICVRWAVTNPLKHPYLQVLGTCQAVYTVRGYTRSGHGGRGVKMLTDIWSADRNRIILTENDIFFNQIISRNYKGLYSKWIGVLILYQINRIITLTAIRLSGTLCIRWRDLLFRNPQFYTKSKNLMWWWYV